LPGFLDYSHSENKSLQAADKCNNLRVIIEIVNLAAANDTVVKCFYVFNFKYKQQL